MGPLSPTVALGEAGLELLSVSAQNVYVQFGAYAALALLGGQRSVASDSYTRYHGMMFWCERAVLINTACCVVA